MTNEELIHQIIALNPEEQIAKDYYEAYHRYLDFSQFLLVFQNSNEHFTPKQLASPESKRRQQAIHAQFFETYGKNLSADSFIAENRDIEVEQLPRYVDIPLHRHDFFECVMVLYGYCEQSVSSQIYRHQKGNFAIIPPGIDHHLRPSPDCLCLTIKIRENIFHNMDLPNFPHFVYPICFQVGEDPFIFNNLLSLYVQQREHLPYADQITLLLFQTILTFVCQNYWDTLQHLAPHTMQSSQMLEITNYIFENYQTVSLSSLAKHYHFSTPYLSTMIKRQTGTSFTEILKDIRLKHAVRLLTLTKMPLNHICAEIGYHDVSQFISIFRQRYGISPTQYRRKNAKQDS